MCDTSWYYDDVPLVDFRDDLSWAILPTKAQISATCGDAQYLVRGSVEVTRAIHGVAPVWDDRTDGLKMRLDVGCGCRG